MSTPRLLAAATAVVLLGCGEQPQARGSEFARGGPLRMPSAWSLYVSDATIGRGAWHLSSIDKVSLRDSPGIDLRGFGYPIASADGSTLAWIDSDHLQDGKAHVIDPTTGRDRASFGGLAMHGSASLTPDGSGLLVLSQQGWGWELVRAANGRVVADMSWKDPCCGPYFFWLSPDGRYMYRVLTAVSGPRQPAGPSNPVLVRYDLQTGREVSRLRLTGVVAGVWTREASPASAHLSLQLIPGVALSPDGGTLAIVHADSETLSLVDLQRWQIASPRPLTRAGSFWDRLRIRAVTDVQAKEVEGPEWDALFLPDGQTLVAWGRSMSAGSQATVRSLGIRTIDVGSAGIRMEVPGGDQLTQVVPAPDGSAIYAITEADQPAAPADDRLVVLSRLDPRTLAVTAARTFRGRRTLMALASA